MKRLLAIVVLGLLFSGNTYANNLIGKKLVCKNPKGSILGIGSTYYEFINDKEVKSSIIREKSYEVFERINYYNAYAKTIDIFLSRSTILLYTIDRQTLKTSSGYKCEVVNFNIKGYLQKQSRELINKHSKDNKI